MLVLARVLVVSLSLIGLLIAAQGSFEASRSGWNLLQRERPTFDEKLRQFESVRRELGAEVPAGSRIYLDESVQHLWRQRIIEFAYLEDLTVTDQIQQADFLVTLGHRRDRSLDIIATRLDGGQR